MIEKKQVLVTQRMEGAFRGLLWEFPGGKVRDSEDPREAMRRELKEELDIDVEVGEILDVIYHSYPEYPILLLAYHCRLKSGIPKPIGCRDLRWVRSDELKELAMPPADEPIRQRLVASGGGLV
jgi:8-oxo-dGTP diphosphatase